VGLQTVRSDNYFLGDDFGLVQHLHNLPAQRFLHYFVSDWTEGAYGFVLDELRPVLAFTYWLDAHLFGATNASGYHATNLILHILNTLLVLGIARSVAPGQPLFAAVAASFFALMPSHAEPIAWISGRVDSLAAVFYLGTLLCFMRFRLEQGTPWLFASLLMFVVGLFTKQSVVTLPALIVAFDWLWFRTPDRRVRSVALLWAYIPFFVLAGAYLALRHALFGNAVREDLLSLETIQQFIVRQLTYARMLLPAHNSAPTTMTVFAGVATVGLMGVCGWWAFVRRPTNRQWLRQLLFFGPAWYAITIAPMVVTYSSARHLYITAAGLSIAMASLILPPDWGGTRRRTQTRLAMAAAALLLYAVASARNISTWVVNGRESHIYFTSITGGLQLLPRDSLVFLRAPDRYGAQWFWAWATPFALQPPFTHEDLYGKFRIVDRPEMYCCPFEQWVAARKETLASFITSPGPQQVTYFDFSPGNAGAEAASTRTVDTPALRRQIETAVGKPIETVVTSMTVADAEQVAGFVLR
jgi:hypothetical protein